MCCSLTAILDFCGVTRGIVRRFDGGAGGLGREGYVCVSVLGCVVLCGWVGGGDVVRKGMRWGGL